jgi:hypothetical protein
MSFKEVCKKVQQISPQWPLDETIVMWSAANTVPKDNVIVEAGSYRGYSTTVLASTGKRVIAVDPFIVAAPEPPDSGCDLPQITEEDYKIFLENITPYSNVAPIRCKCMDYVHQAWPIGFFLHDAHHAYPHPLDDFNHISQWLAPGALAGFHDHGRRIGVTKSLDELVAYGTLQHLVTVGTFWLGQYTGKKFVAPTPEEPKENDQDN